MSSTPPELGCRMGSPSGREPASLTPEHSEVAKAFAEHRRVAVAEG
ncbi:MAG: hypothetical protein JOZ19_03535 [Rubrobacter sp.]|nr:hypothetical protein [Rubrobacter sp.]